ncbi:MAG: DUF4178 domain-containing protein [Alphaproteobacteria bacterium]
MSTADTNIQAINCTACGATLDVLGGHRVRSLTCGYCGSVMDRHAGFQVVERHQNKPDRPYAPIALGMQSTLKGVPFTVIGMIQYVSHQSGPGWAESYDWISFQLFSPTHGYAWLTWNKGHYLFSYRTRDLPEPVVPKSLNQKDRVRLGERTFRMFERYAAEVAYVEGELTWIARRGDKTHEVEAIDPPYLFSYEQSDDELEYSIGDYLDADEVHAAFGIEPAERPEGIHPAQPFRPSGLVKALAKVGPIFAGVAILGLFAVSVLGSGREIVQSRIDDPSSTTWTVPFTVADAGRLLKIELSSDVQNNWVYYDIDVNDAKTDAWVLSLGQELSFYEGRDSDGRWTEGSKQAEALFKLPTAGDYEIEITASEAGGTIPPLGIRLYDGILVKRYFVVLLILSVLAALALPVMQKNFEKRRWDDVLEDDDDD